VDKIIAASILSADFTCLGKQLVESEKAGIGWIHFDVMDGHFVPNISFGIPVLASIRGSSKLTFDVHLMISDPARYVNAFRDAGADIITVHVEACSDIQDCLLKIRESGAKVGLSINPGTSVDEGLPYLGEVDLVLFMGVEPGFGGQKFNPQVLEKISTARNAIDAGGFKTLIQVDGGVNLDTAADISMAGCDVFVAGSFIYDHPEGISRATQILREKI